MPRINQVDGLVITDWLRQGFRSCRRGSRLGPVGTLGRVFAVVLAPFHYVRTMEHGIFGLRLNPNAIEKERKRGSFPFADAAPAFNAVMACDLCPGRH